MTVQALYTDDRAYMHGDELGQQTIASYIGSWLEKIEDKIFKVKP